MLQDQVRLGWSGCGSYPVLASWSEAVAEVHNHSESGLGNQERSWGVEADPEVGPQVVVVAAKDVVVVGEVALVEEQDQDHLHLGLP